MALGETGLGGLLVSKSKSMADFFSAGRTSRLLSRMLAIWGWIFLAGGSLCIAVFLILIAVIAFQSL
jgi:hypothetical protein